MHRIHNFCAGPAALPLPVLEQARAELLDYHGAGMSIMEMSHRGKLFDEVIQTAEKNVRKLMNVSDDYAVLFLQGGASQQFAMIPQNLLLPGQTADYLNTGAWSQKAIKEAKITGQVNVAWDGKADNYLRARDRTRRSSPPAPPTFIFVPTKPSAASAIPSSSRPTRPSSPT